MAGCTDPRGNVRLTVRVTDGSATPDPETPEGPEADTTQTRTTRARVGDYEIEQAHLYVFDAGGRYITSAENDRPLDGGAGYEFWLTLPGDDYDFVVWTNQGGDYRVRQSVEELEADGFTMDNLEVFLDHGGRLLTDTIPHLLHGITRGHTIIEDADNRVEVAIVPKTYTVNLRAINLPRGDDDYSFSITDNNSHYTFGGDLIEEKPQFTHIRTAPARGGEFKASIRTLTLSADRHPRFTFTDETTGTVMHDADLIYTITRAYRAASRAVDFSSTYVYDILLSFDAMNMEFTVSVNGWEHKEPHEILD
jgi:hypothetical protein